MGENTKKLSAMNLKTARVYCIKLVLQEVYKTIPSGTGLLNQIDSGRINGVIEKNK